MNRRLSLPDEMERWVDPLAQVMLGVPRRPGAGFTSGEPGPVPPVAIRAAPAALGSLLGVLLIVFWTAPIRPYTDGVWEPADLIRLCVLGLIVGALNPSVAGLVGTIVGAAAAMAIQVYVLTEQASWTPDVVANLREPGWSGQVLGALAIGLAILVAGHLVGAGLALARARRRSSEPASAALSRPALVVVGTLVAAAVLATVLVRATAASAYVPDEPRPVVQVTVVGDRIVALAPETVAAGRILIETTRTGSGAQASDVLLDGPISQEGEALLRAGSWRPGGVNQLLWFQEDPGHLARRFQLAPGRYAVVLVSRAEQDIPSEIKSVLDARTIVISGSEPSGRAESGGPIIALGNLFALAVAGWATAGWVFINRRGRTPALAGGAGVVAAGLIWLLEGLAIGQSHSPF